MPRRPDSARRPSQPRRPAPVDPAMVRDLQIYIENNGALYRQQETPIYENLKRKMRKGTYDRKKAVVLWRYLADEGAKRYAKDSRYAGKWHELVSPATREAVATKLRDQNEESLRIDLSGVNK